MILQRFSSLHSIALVAPRRLPASKLISRLTLNRPRLPLASPPGRLFSAHQVKNKTPRWMVTGISITDAGIGYTNAPTIRIGAPPAAVVSPMVLSFMRLDSANLGSYNNYQIQFKAGLGGTWGNWNGGLFRPTGVTNSQYLFITDGTGFFRLQQLP